MVGLLENVGQDEEIKETEGVAYMPEWDGWEVLTVPEEIDTHVPAKREVLFLQVTWQDIWRGKAIKRNACPFALATRRAYGGDVSVGPDWLVLNGTAFPASPEMATWIARFDFLAWLRPLSFLWLRPISVTLKR